MDIKEIERAERLIDDRLGVLKSIIQQSTLNKLVENKDKTREISERFNIVIDVNGVQDQKDSGTCWIYAGTNIIRAKMVSKYKLPCTFDISQAYILKCHKIESCAMVLDHYFDLAQQDLAMDSKEVLMTELFSPLTDGGNMHIFIKLVEKYGSIPREAYPHTYHSQNTSEMNTILKTIVRRAKARIFCKGVCKTKRHFVKLKKETMFDCIKVLSACLGTTPQTFKWTPDIMKHPEEEYTPLQFYKKFAFPMRTCVSLSHNPLFDRNTILSKTDKIGMCKCYNTDLGVMKTAARTCLEKLKMPVGVAARMDVRFFFSEILDTESSVIEKLFDINLKEDKHMGIQTFNNKANHEMVIVGCQYDKKKNKYLRWKIQNSWGGKAKGIIVMSDVFFDEYVHEITVPKSVLKPGFLQGFKKTIEFEWDDPQID